MDDIITSDAPLAPELVAAAQAALEQLTQRLPSCERALVLIDDGEGWKAAAAHNLSTQNFWLVAKSISPSDWRWALSKASFWP